jgi:exopolysaccharide biosynthesis polyprenyl glycosylphosphotransferase
MNPLRPLERAGIIVSDFLLAILAYMGMFLVRAHFGYLDAVQGDLAHQIDQGVLLAVVVMVWFQFFGLYRDWFLVSRTKHLLAMFRASFLGTVIILIALCGSDAIAQTLNGHISLGLTRARAVTAFSFGGLIFALLSIGRMIIQSALRALVTQGAGLENTLILGASTNGWRVARDLRLKPRLGMNPIGFISSLPRKRDGDPSDVPPILGNLDQAVDIIRKHNVRHVVISQETESHNEILQILAILEEVNVRIFLIPDLFDVVSGHLRTGTVWATDLLELYPDHMPTWQAGIKRIIDIVSSLMILLFVSPFLCLAMLAIRFTSPGSIFYTQERIGQYGRRFWVWKLRTMRTDAEKSGPQWAGKQDPRITPIGLFLRKTRMDEVPQLWCVLRGDMSLVGPRPEREYFIEKLRNEVPLYVRRLKMKPGLTGWAQVTLGYDNSIEDVKRKVAADLWYFEHMSIALDLQIMLRTVWVVLTGKGAN